MVLLLVCLQSTVQSILCKIRAVYVYVWCGLLRILLYISRDRAEEVEEVSDGRFGFNHKLVLRYVLYYYVYILSYILIYNMVMMYVVMGWKGAEAG